MFASEAEEPKTKQYAGYNIYRVVDLGGEQHVCHVQQSHECQQSRLYQSQSEHLRHHY